MPELRIEAVRKSFGGVAAVDDCTFEVDTGTITGLIGPNGSGKSTLINLISGYLSLDSGAVTFRGQPIDGLKPDQVYRRGLSRTFQRARIFPQMTVEDNMLAAVPRRGASILRLGRSTTELERAHRLLDDFRLARLRSIPAGELSYGQTKLLEFASVLMAQPSMLLLDEPTAGVNPTLVDVMAEQIRKANAGGVTVLVIEHNMEFIMSLSDQIVVLNAGRVIFTGEPEGARNSPVVLDAYLGA